MIGGVNHKFALLNGSRAIHSVESKKYHNLKWKFSLC